MSEKGKNSKKLKDLDPKSQGKGVKGGICCIPLGVLRAANRAAGRAQSDARKALDPR